MVSAVPVEPEPPEPPDFPPPSRVTACSPLLSAPPLLGPLLVTSLLGPLLATSLLVNAPPPLLAHPLIELRRLRSSLTSPPPPLGQLPPRKLRHLRSWPLGCRVSTEINISSCKAYSLQYVKVEKLSGPKEFVSYSDLYPLVGNLLIPTYLSLIVITSPPLQKLPNLKSGSESYGAKSAADIHGQAPSPLPQVKIVSTTSQSRTQKLDLIPSLVEKMVLARSTTIDIYLYLGFLPPQFNQSLVWVFSNRCEPPDPPVPPDSSPSRLLFSTGHIFLTPWNYVELTGLSPIARVVLLRLKFPSLHLLLHVVFRLALGHSLPLNEDHLTASCRSLPLYEDHFAALCRPLPRIEDHLAALCRPLPRIEDLDILPLYEDFVTLPLYEDIGSSVEFVSPLCSPFVLNVCVARGVIKGSSNRCLIASVAILEIGNCALAAVPISGVRSSTQDSILLNNLIVEEIQGLLQDFYLFMCYVVIIHLCVSAFSVVVSAFYAWMAMLFVNSYSVYGD